MWSTRSSSVRTSIGFDSWFFGRILNVSHLDEVYIGTSSGMPAYINTAQGLRFRLGGNFYTNFEVDLNYNRDSESGKRKTDTSYILGLSYEQDYR
jgi:hypothetical protein